MKESESLCVTQCDTGDSRDALRRWTYRPRRRHRAWSPKVPGRRWPCRASLRASYKLARSAAITASRDIHLNPTVPAGAACRDPAISSASRAWKTMRPMRPNPLMPIFTAIAISTMGQEFGDALARMEHCSRMRRVSTDCHCRESQAMSSYSLKSIGAGARSVNGRLFVFLATSIQTARVGVLTALHEAC